MNRFLRRGRGLLAIGALLLGGAGISAQGAEAKAPQVSSEEARQVLRAHCGPCHHGDSPERKPKAMAVFDDLDTAWHVRLSDRQLRAAINRVQSMGTPEELKWFTAFIDAELARRAQEKPAGAKKP